MAGSQRCRLSRRRLLGLGGAVVALTGVTDAVAQANRSSAQALDFFVNPSNPTTHLDIEKVRSLYLGDREYWPNDRRIALVVWEIDSDPQREFLERVMNMSAREWRNHWMQRRYSGRATSTPFVVASAEAAARYLEHSEGAIAFSLGQPLPGRLVRTVAAR
jgi:hypothetical protein